MKMQIEKIYSEVVGAEERAWMGGSLVRKKHGLKKGVLRAAHTRTTSGVARAFPGGQLAHPEGQNEEEN